MIPFDFEYYQPATISEAVNLYADLTEQGKKALYYGGGTEIISFCRLYQLYPQAVIDVKAIPELNALQEVDEKLVIGAAKTLGQIQESNPFPLLSQCGGRVADRTIRNKITLGGNLCARIPYRETALALLVGEAEVVVWGKNGKKTLPINKVFHQCLRLDAGELLTALHINKSCCAAPYLSLKKTSDGQVGYPQDRVGYPVVSAAGLKIDNKIKVAFSGVCAFPFRSAAVEEALNEKSGRSREEKIERAADALPAVIQEDVEGSAEYREFVLKNMMAEILERLA